MKLSHSSMSIFRECPGKWEFKYVDRMPEKPKHYFSFGNSIHSALEAMYSGESCPSADGVVAAMGRGWRSEGYVTEAAEAKAKHEGEKMLRAYHAKHAAEWRKPLAVEVKLDFTINHVQLTGYVDRIDAVEGGVMVLDYKTGKSFDLGRILEDPQLTLYQIAVDELGLGEVRTLCLYHVPTLAAHVAPRRSAEMVEALATEVVAVAGRIAAGEFPLTPSEDACRHCDFKAMCPEWRRG